MVAFIGLLSLFGFFACIVMAIVNAIRKKPVKPVAIGMIACFVVFVVCLIVTPSVENTQQADNTETTESVQNFTPKEETTPSNTEGPSETEEAVANEENSQSEEVGTTETTIVVEETTEVEIPQDVETESVDTQHKILKGRGRADIGRSEPEYVGLIGYVATEDGYSIDNVPIEEWVWEIPTYTQDKQFWVESGKIEHKTEVLVLEQYLEHKRYGYYSGMLLVERQDTKEQIYINVADFVTHPYWAMDDIYEAAKYGELIAEFNQQSDYYPVTKGGHKAEIEDGSIVLITGLTGTYPNLTPDYHTNQLEATVLSGWKEGSKVSTVFINVDDLKIIY